MTTNQKVPVTILTGFLGSGKTTLLNKILSEEHGKRIAVIENEYGEVGIDQGLVINADEEVFEMSNGCICCTVRGDLVEAIAWRPDDCALASINAKGGITVWDFKMRTQTKSSAKGFS